MWGEYLFYGYSAGEIVFKGKFMCKFKNAAFILVTTCECMTADSHEVLFYTYIKDHFMLAKVKGK